GGPCPCSLLPPRLAPGNQHALPVKGARHGSTEPWRCCSAKVVRRHLPLRLIEMPQVGWRLARSARPQLAVNLDVVGLPLDENIVVVLGTAVLDPNRVTRAAIAAGDCPGAGQRVVNGRDLVAQNVRVRFVKEDALPDDSLIVLVQRNAARIEDARPLEIARL